jgi:hypothetical protein
MVITVVIMLKQRAVVRAFQRAAATAPETACTPARLGLRPGLAWHRLVAHAVLRCPGEGRYFLDVPNWQRLRRGRRRIAMGVIVALLLALAVIVLATRHH